MGGNDDCTTMWMYLMPLKCTLKTGDDGNILYVYFKTIKKIIQRNK